MLVSVNDLQVYMDISFTNRQQDAAEFVLEGLQSELETFLGRPVEVDTFVEEHVVENNYVGVPTSSFFYNLSLDTTQNPLTFIQPPYTIYLRQTPVVSVSEVTIQSPTLDPVVQNPVTDYVVRRFGIDLYRAYANDTITVTYQGGLAGAGIKYFKLLILRAATREMQNMHDDVVGIKDLESRNVAPLQTGFTELELASVRGYRRRRVA